MKLNMFQSKVYWNIETYICIVWKDKSIQEIIENLERSEELMLSILIAYLADNFAITDHYHCAVDFWPWLKNFALVWKCANSIWFIKKTWRYETSCSFIHGIDSHSCLKKCSKVHKRWFSYWLDDIRALFRIIT